MTEILEAAAPPAVTSSSVAPEGSAAGAEVGDEISAREAAALEVAESEWALGLDKLESAHLEREMERTEFPVELRVEKDRLLREGFSTWTRRDHKSFVTACERYEKDNRAAVVTEVCETTDKPQEEVQRYYDVFWARGPEQLPEWRKMEEKFARAHERLARVKDIDVLIRGLVTKDDDPARTLPIPYVVNTKSTYVKGFTEEEDRFLVCMISKLGEPSKFNYEKSRNYPLPRTPPLHPQGTAAGML